MPKIVEKWLFKRSLQIFVLQIMQNNTSHPKSLIINYVIIWITFEQNILLCEDCRKLNF